MKHAFAAYVVFIAFTALGAPKSLEPLKLASAAFDKEHWTDCLRYAVVAEATYPNNPETYFYAGMCAERIGKVEMAYEAFLSARALGRDDREIYRNLCVLSLKNSSVSNTDKHIKEFEHHFPKDKDLPELKQMLASLKAFKETSDASDKDTRDLIVESYLANEKRGSIER